jgi:NAD+ synthase (glutamine-hydrolysing)
MVVLGERGPLFPSPSRPPLLHFCHMYGIRAALVQVNVAVGALSANAAKILRLARQARDGGARLIAFPELALSGYPPEDLVLKRHFLDDAREELRRLAAELPTDAVVVVGAPYARSDERAANAAVVFHGGEVRAVYRKCLLPNYGVFDEKRVFEAGTEPLILDLDGCRIGLHICEDSWFPEEGPCTALAAAGLDAVLNISGSPYHRGKLALREEILHRAAARIGAPLLYCNLVGGQDELVFDGASMMIAGGRVVARAKQFEEDVLFVELGVGSREKGCGPLAQADFSNLLAPVSHLPSPRLEAPLDDHAEVYAALQLGLRDYVNKNGFSQVIVAVSGGIDSALVATLAVDALGAERVKAVTMPSRFSSAETLGDAELLARNLGVQLYRLPIETLHAGFLDTLAPLWPGRKADATEENIQARIRGVIVMALSNKFGWLVLTTGNKSELATGYCTLYGDMAGGFAVLKDVPKTLVFELARWRNTQGGAKPPAEPQGGHAARRDASPYPATPGTAPIPVTTIDRPPTAELRPNQKDQDSLPPYDVLDRIIERYVERDLGAAQIVAEGFDAATVRQVIRLIDISEYKRRQGAPGVKITPKAFGRDRRLPITNLYRERV